ncbi:MAG: cysteine-rich CWC family protein [Bacteroidetes bacterium]|nr:cysteine-rich CWC family protein [Bacteroidales bacterium]MBU1009501.1 cysteine-rich CWC family protein [Bacteroidota bacterium]
MKLIEPEKCPRCGNDFHCSKSARCWCYAVSIEVSLLEQIQEKWAGCLCPDCLKALAKKSRDEGFVDLVK